MAILIAIFRADICVAQRTSALLVGVSDYFEAREFQPLPFAARDITLLDRTLRDASVDIAVTAMHIEREPRFQPNCVTILNMFEDQIDMANREQLASLFFFFAGHGLRDPLSGELYLAPRDCRTNDLNRKAIPISWIRGQLARCPSVPCRVIVLDTCHAAAGSMRLSASELVASLGKTDGLTQDLLVFASCGPDQTSIDWTDRQHGLFSFWFCVGLSGWADRQGLGNADGWVDDRELECFVRHMTVHTLDLLAARAPDGQRHAQTPVVIRPPDQMEPIRLVRAVQAATADNLLPIQQQAERYLSGGRADAARIELEKALRLAPWDPELCAWRAKSLIVEFGRTRFEETLTRALADLDTAILLAQTIEFPRDDLAELYRLRAAALEKLKRHPLAELDQAAADQLAKNATKPE